MAKSLRSKSKRAFRAKKRESGKYAAADAARLDRLYARLAAAKDGAAPSPLNGDARADDDEDENATEDQHMGEEGQGQIQVQGGAPDTVQDGDGMVLDVPAKPAPVSTHGRRSSRREEWRKSKGMGSAKHRGMNRQGGLAARRRAGRPSRRR